MPRILFTGDFDYHPKRGVLIAYRAGFCYLVKQEAAKQALARGVAKELPPKESTDARK